MCVCVCACACACVCVCVCVCVCLVSIMCLKPSLGMARPLHNRMIWEHQHTKVVLAAIIAFQWISLFLSLTCYIWQWFNCTRDWTSYTDRLSVLNLDTLILRRSISKLCFMYKIINDLVAAPFPLHNLDHGYATRSHDLCLRYYHAHSNSFCNSFTNSSIHLWNKLPSHVVHATSFDSFKTQLHKFLSSISN